MADDRVVVSEGAERARMLATAAVTGDDRQTESVIKDILAGGLTEFTSTLLSLSHVVAGLLDVIVQHTDRYTSELEALEDVFDVVDRHIAGEGPPA